MAITATEARKNLFGLLEQVNADRTPVQITSRRGDAYLIAAEEYDALQETLHLLRSPANRARLLRSLDDARAGRVTQRDLVDPDASTP
jgi:antitoxin YefM